MVFVRQPLILILLHYTNEGGFQLKVIIIDCLTRKVVMTIIVVDVYLMIVVDAIVVAMIAVGVVIACTIN